MLGGGWARGSNEGIDALGNATDDENTIYETAYLGGLLPALFPSLVQGVTVEQAWTGTLGFSVDSLPWVGPVGIPFRSLTRKQDWLTNRRYRRG
jgi:hypothetical protein